MPAYEVNFDGLVGLTHNYSGLSFGNVASTANKTRVANPKKAALQGLAKMKALADMGLKQAILPPQERPCLMTLRQLGFSGTDEMILNQVAKQDFALLAHVSSASSMWVANAATVSPMADALDGRLHLTVANLNNKFHRSIESETTYRALQAIFPSSGNFSVHPALPAQSLFGDEGAANHNRLCREYGEQGVEVFVYGSDVYCDANRPIRYPARQTRQASEAVARLHQLDEQATVFVQQNPRVIDQGVFHNDVIAVSNGPVLFYHQDAFLRTQSVCDEIRDKLLALDCPFVPIEVSRDRVSVADAVGTYLFNSQLLTKLNGKMVLVVPQEVYEHQRVYAYLSELVEQHQSMLDEIKVFDLRESMRNGGGPACLRLRVVLTSAQLAQINPNVLMNDVRYEQLVSWVNQHYRDRLSEQDLADPQLLFANCVALDELTQILRLGAIYPFQR